MNWTACLHVSCSFLRRRLLPFALGAMVPAAYGQPTNVQLPAAVQGSAAVTALGAYLPDVAKAYGLEAQQLVNLFATQPSLWVDPAGALLFACEGLSVTPQGQLVNAGRVGGAGAMSASAASDAMTADSSVTAIANGDAVDAFKLHSLPGVSRVIFLDFDGHTTTGTSWNTSYASGSAIVSAPFDLDGSPTTFGSSERALIQKIWQRVAEDYAPFGVDVTTEDPGLEALRKSTSSDTVFGIRVVISPTNWYNTGAGGVAYIGSFSWNTDTPCFAFTQQLANGEKYIAEAIAHEVGHTVGLYHDGLSGTGATEYYSGQGSWAPIMGVGYYKSIVQFSKGEYANANNTQDDLTVMASHLPLAADDHGGTSATATLLSGPSVSTGGTIETRNDVDLFRFDASAGSVALEIKGPAPDANLDVKAELLDAGGRVLLTSDATSGLTATLATDVAAGTYFVRVVGVGNGDPVTTGYSNYGSLGNYLITGTFPTSGVNQPPIAVATGLPTSGTAPLTVDFSGAGSTDPDGTIASYGWSFGNGASATGAMASATYTMPGTYSAVLTVVDDGGLAGTSTVVVTVAAAPNVSPVANILANPTSGLAPLAVGFSGAASTDADGSIATYLWEFGDGTTSTAAAPGKTYSVSGNYTARLTVTDNQGATASSTIGVSVSSNPDLDVDISTFTLTGATAKSGSTGTATIVVLDRLNRPVSGAVVTIQWSGVVAGTSSGKTDAAGRIILNSPRTKKAGTLTATVSTVTPPAGRSYDASIFAPTDALVRSVTF